MSLLTDCDRCRRSTTRLVRQSMGCGYEPPPPKRLPVAAWHHEGDPRREPPTTCPGYTCNLPEVVYVSRARFHWTKGQLAAFLGGEPASEALLLAIELLEIEANRARDWDHKHPPET
jgi:hypothetical protein